MRKYLLLLLPLTISSLAIYGVAVWKGMDSFLFAWILNFMLMMCLLSLTQTLKPKLTSNYYATKQWENGGRIYRYIGVNLFRKILVWIGWEKLNKKTNPVEKSLNSLSALEYGTRQSEFGHLVIFMIVLVITVFVALKFGLSKAWWLLGLNLILNFYPIILQRYNRPRLKRAMLLGYQR